MDLKATTLIVKKAVQYDLHLGVQSAIIEKYLAIFVTSTILLKIISK